MPLVAMTRETGSLGQEVAARLSERLRTKIVHHEIIDHPGSVIAARVRPAG
jgi:hypothetical protein